MFENKEPQDIFDGVDQAAGATPPPARPVVQSPTAPQPLPPLDGGVVPPTPVSRPALASPQYERRGGHVVKTLVILLVAFVAIGTSGFLAYRALMPDGTDSILPDSEVEGENDENIPDGKGDADDEEDEDDTNDNNSDTSSSATVDSDGDGLTNAEELDAGTSVSKPDTDSDGLGDKEELQVYGTDPRRTDTDGDGFFDGQEVRGGYNPNGPGKILEVPKTE